MSTTNEQDACEQARSTTQSTVQFPMPYDTFLLQYKDHIHAVIQDILNCSTEAIRRTNVHNIENVLSLFIGPSLHKKKEELVEFLRLLPEYKTTDQDLLYERLKALKDHLRRTEGDSDLYFYALRKYRKTNENNEEE